MICVLCDEEVSKEDQYIMNCGHIVHMNCGCEHFKENYHCPSCNKIVENISNAVAEIILVLPNEEEVVTEWKLAYTLDDLFSFIMKFSCITSDEIYLKIGSYIYKSSESYNLLNVQLNKLIFENNTKIEVSNIT